MTMFATSFCRFLYKPERDCVWVEIPIERSKAFGEKTIHSEIMITQKKEIVNINKGMPHIEKILFNVEPSNSSFNIK